jgi:hypothetical protein
MVSDADADSSPRTYAPHDWFPDGAPVVIRLMPEYSVEVPLFPQSDRTDALVPVELLAKLIRWQKEFRSELPLGERLAINRGKRPMGRLRRSHWKLLSRWLLKGRLTWSSIFGLCLGADHAPDHRVSGDCRPCNGTSVTGRIGHDGLVDEPDWPYEKFETAESQQYVSLTESMAREAAAAAGITSVRLLEGVITMERQRSRLNLFVRDGVVIKAAFF